MSTEVMAIDPRDAEQFFKQVEKHIGVALDESKIYLISSRLTPLVLEHNLQSHANLLRQLISTPVGPLHWQAFEAMTTNETSFFRDTHPFEVLKKTILPALIKKYQDKKEINIWCAASSTGQEPYSIAILLKEYFPELANWKIQIWATDISEVALAKASLGIYNQTEIARGLTDAQISRHFIKLPNGHYEIHTELRSMVQFKYMNLIQDWSLIPKFDLILMRNVLIYFNQDTKASIIKRLHSQLVDLDAYLMLGSSESILFDKTFKAVQSDRVTYYHKDQL